MLHVSIVDHANTADLLRCLATLPAACEGIDWRLSVIENVAATDVSAVRAAVPEAEVLVNPRPLGFGANHNQVLRRLLADPATDHVLVLNDDTELPAGSIAALVRCLDAHPEAGAASPRLVDAEGREQTVLLRFPTVLGEVRAALGRPGEVGAAGDGWLTGACLLLRVEALRRVGLFDERFFLFYEDTDLSARLRAGGWARIVCGGSRVVHRGHATVGASHFGTTMDRQMARSQYLYVAKHHGALAAETVRRATRAARAARAVKAVAEARRHPGEEAQQHAAFLRELAAYDARRALPHEAA